MHNAGFRSAGLDWKYELPETTPKEFAGTVARLRADDCMGANITIPHKQAIIKWLDGVTPRAHTIDAVNTAIRKDGKLTRFLRGDARAGAQTISGIAMLVYQGAAAFELWTGSAATVDLMRQAARHAPNGA
jgi:shikimate dehydrogenase